MRPSDGFVLNEAYQTETGITYDTIKNNGLTLREVINQFNDSCYTNYTRENKSFC